MSAGYVLIACFIPDIGNLWLLSFFFVSLLVLLEIVTFTDISKNQILVSLTQSMF